MVGVGTELVALGSFALGPPPRPSASDADRRVGWWLRDLLELEPSPRAGLSHPLEGPSACRIAWFQAAARGCSTRPGAAYWLAGARLLGVAGSG